MSLRLSDSRLNSKIPNVEAKKCKMQIFSGLLPSHFLFCLVQTRERKSGIYRKLENMNPNIGCRYIVYSSLRTRAQ